MAPSTPHITSRHDRLRGLVRARWSLGTQIRPLGPSGNIVEAHTHLEVHLSVKTAEEQKLAKWPQKRAFFGHQSQMSVNYTRDSEANSDRHKIKMSRQHPKTMKKNY